MNQHRRRGRVVIGVDTHKYIHVAVALDNFGGILGAEKFTADTLCYEQLIDWSMSHGHLLTFAIEGTGSYGAGLTGAVRRRDIRVVEVMRTDRRDRRLRGKSDFLDAENAARTVLAALSEIIADVRALTATFLATLMAVLVNAPPPLREQLQSYPGYTELSLATAEWVAFYNRQRPNGYCQDLTPDRAEALYYHRQQHPHTEEALK